jgi:hypothetical protein
MSPEDALREKLRKIEALFSGATIDGEKSAAGAAADRIRQRLGQSCEKETSIEMKFSIGDPWSRQLFLALCRRYGIQPYRRPGMHRQTIIIRATKSFVQDTLWPEFEELNAALINYRTEITQRIINEEVHRETGDAEEIPDTALIENNRHNLLK